MNIILEVTLNINILRFNIQQNLYYYVLNTKKKKSNLASCGKIVLCK